MKIYLISELRFVVDQCLTQYGFPFTPPIGRTVVRRTATTKLTGQWRLKPTLPGCASTWGLPAGSFTTGPIPCWTRSPTTLPPSVSSMLVSYGRSWVCVSGGALEPNCVFVSETCPLSWKCRK